MIKVKYRVFGRSKEYIATVHKLSSTEDLRQLVKEHTTSQSAFLYNVDLPEAQVELTKNGIINTFIYNKGEDVMDFLNHPLSFFDKDLSFPMSLTDRLQEVLDDRKEQPSE